MEASEHSSASSRTSGGQVSWQSNPPALGTDTDFELLARVALRLVRDYGAWVRRRVETISYVADSTIRRQMSVDFVLPRPDSADADDPMGELSGGTLIWVPLWLPKKEPFTNFDAWDEAERALSILNKRENGALAGRALVLLLEQSGVHMDAEEEAYIEAIARSDAKTARADLEEMGDWLDRALDAETTGRVLFDDFADAFMLLAPIRYEPGVPRVIKWAYDAPLDWHGEHPKDEGWGRRLVTAVGLLDKVQMFTDVEVGLSESYHVEIVAPDDVLVSDAVMVASQWSPEEAEQVTYDVSVAPQCERAHLNVSMIATKEDDDMDGEKARADSAAVVLTLRARRTPAFWGLWITALLITLMLALVRWRVRDLEATDAAALLLVFPALVAAYLARPGEHVLAARLLGGVRFLALLAAVCSLAATAMIAGGLLQTASAKTNATAFKCLLNDADRSAVCRSVQPQAASPSPSALMVVDGLMVVAGLCALILFMGLRAPPLLDRRRERRRKKLVQPLVPTPGS